MDINQATSLVYASITGQEVEVSSTQKPKSLIPGFIDAGKTIVTIEYNEPTSNISTNSIGSRACDEYANFKTVSLDLDKYNYCFPVGENIWIGAEVIQYNVPYVYKFYRNDVETTLDGQYRLAVVFKDNNLSCHLLKASLSGKYYLIEDDIPLTSTDRVIVHSMRDNNSRFFIACGLEGIDLDSSRAYGDLCTKTVSEVSTTLTYSVHSGSTVKKDLILPYGRIEVIQVIIAPNAVNITNSSNASGAGVRLTKNHTATPIFM